VAAGISILGLSRSYTACDNFDTDVYEKRRKGQPTEKSGLIFLKDGSADTLHLCYRGQFCKQVLKATGKNST
jgi:hypothetical protein